MTVVSSNRNLRPRIIINTSFIFRRVLLRYQHFIIYFGLQEFLLLYQHILRLAQFLDRLGRRRSSRLLLAAENFAEETHRVLLSSIYCILNDYSRLRETRACRSRSKSKVSSPTSTTPRPPYPLRV